jgi:hypothetical protein
VAVVARSRSPTTVGSQCGDTVDCGGQVVGPLSVARDESPVAAGGQRSLPVAVSPG